MAVNGIQVFRTERQEMKMDKKGEAKIGKVMGEYKEGKLKSSSGQKVKSRDQAVAIAISEAAKKMGRSK